MVLNVSQHGVNGADDFIASAAPAAICFGIAVAEEIDATLRRACSRARRLEARLLPKRALELLPILPLNQVGLLCFLRGLLALPWVRYAQCCSSAARPQAVLGVGGYAGGPVVLVAALRAHGDPEPNASRFLNACSAAIPAPGSCAWARRAFGKKGVLTGNPVRGGFKPAPARPRDGAASLLVFGGSQGSRILNAALVAALPFLPSPATLSVVHQTGDAMREGVAAAYAQAGRGAEIIAFLDDMQARLRAADLVVCRSGATTCAELQVAGKAALLVPAAGRRPPARERARDAGGRRPHDEEVLTRARRRP